MTIAKIAKYLKKSYKFIIYDKKNKELSEADSYLTLSRYLPSTTVIQWKALIRLQCGEKMQLGNHYILRQS